MIIRACSIQAHVPGWGSVVGHLRLLGGLCVLHGLSVAWALPAEPVVPAALRSPLLSGVPGVVADVPVPADVARTVPGAAAMPTLPDRRSLPVRVKASLQEDRNRAFGGGLARRRGLPGDHPGVGARCDVLSAMHLHRFPRGWRPGVA